MAMTVMHNSSAMMALGELNKNSKTLGKELKKVSSGMKINGADDDAAGYAISERMRVQLRSLSSAHDNTQNGCSLLKTAEGAVSSTVDCLKTFKEKAIDAANDTNTDADRAIIQKELDQYMEQIDDNALVTFNGKRLLDGSQGGNVVASQWDAMVSFMSRLDDADLPAQDALNDAINYASCGMFKTEKDLIEGFLGDVKSSGLEACGINLDNDDTGAITGKDAMNEQVKTADSIVPEKENPYGGAPKGTTTINGLSVTWPDNGNDTMKNAIAGALDSPWLKNCMDLIDESYALNFWEKGTSVKSMNVVLADEGASGTLAYVTNWSVGGTASRLQLTVNMHYYNNLDTSNWNGASSVSGAIELDRVIAHEMTHALMAANIKNFSSLPKYIKEGAAELVHGIDDARKSTITRLVNSPDDLRDALENSNATTGDEAYAAGYMVLRYLAKKSAENDPEKHMSFQTGTKASQAMRIGLGDMRCEALGLKKRDGTTVSVTTQAKANSAITVIDRAIGRALKQQTIIGAMQMRLGFTADNITTAHENVTSAESVIRDADMAREFTAYTKANVLSQTAQSMLGQANQNGSQVLSLLQ